ncbi:MAG: cyclopropane-fatty-acyl-phospholipid synthase family protein [Candidatus Paceibacterota bacterium]
MDYSKVVQEIFSQFQGPKFAVRLWDGRTHTYGSGDKTAFTLVLNDEWTAKRLLAQGSLGFGESYMEGKLDVEGDLEAYLRMRHQFKRVKHSWRLALATFLARRNILKNRKDQIAYHYDIGNDFFSFILDKETMSYSAGYYENGTESFGQAQQKKIALLTSWLNLKPGESVLDLGCGWGGFAKYAAEERGLRIKGYSLSRSQLDYCVKLLEKSQAKDKVSLEYADMLEKLPGEQFDGIIMIESIEHVGEKNLPSFFKSLSQVLKPGGPLVLQLTGRYKPKRVDKWTLKYVFPGGYIPAKEELLNAAQEAGFAIETFRDDTPDYIRTITEWIKNLENNRVTIEKMHGPSFYRLWYLWMHGAKVAFEENSMSLFRIHLNKS